MADITPPLPQDRQLIQSYGGGGFRIAGQDYRGSVLVSALQTVAWDVGDPAELNITQLKPLMENVSDGGVLLVGTGTRLVPPDPALRVALRQQGLGIEAMDTGAACRTFNVLLAEERIVYAALIAVE